ncbi:ParM/StbA family protein [Olivibacter sitiensis]|uniref:ParM/StbA family protein n=1 Tax=Olivibacter sitiensis TaxID=376470 RepID=UPI00041DC4BC|nr:ParM/StbA family protein [Olivibacter sitiensis]
MKFFNIPSVIEHHNQPLLLQPKIEERQIELIEDRQTYLVGELALSEGLSPYRNINSSPEDTDYQLLAKAGILLALAGTSGEVAITTGFPYTTYELYKQQAVKFFTEKDLFIDYTAGSYDGLANTKKRMQVTVKHLDVMPEIMGCINAIRKGSTAEKGNFFIVSLGYGTCETGLCAGGNLVTRTCMSVAGLRYAVNGLKNELSREFNLGMKNEHMINQNFQQGSIVLNRKKKDLVELKRTQIDSYYNDVISPTLKKAFTDLDFEKTDRIYLVGGGARYPQLVELFKAEFEDILKVIVPENAEQIASIGYYLRSAEWCGPGLANQAIGLDIGNAYTSICIADPKEKVDYSYNGTPQQAETVSTVYFKGV